MILALHILACISAFSITVMLWLCRHAPEAEEETDFSSDKPLRYLELGRDEYCEVLPSHSGRTLH
jgi:hypothetical protein